jgi:hypothetical protein
MKKLLILLLLIAGACQLKAQQLNQKLPVSPLLKTPTDMGLQQFKLNDSSLFKPKDFSALTKPEQLADLAALNKPDKNSELFYSRMPVARLTGNDKIPTLATENVDRMPVKKIIIVDPLTGLKQPNP